MNRLPGYDRLSIRGKMTLAATLPLVVVLCLVTVAAIALINRWIVADAQKRVLQQLSTAREVLRNEERHLQESIRLSAILPGLNRALTENDRVHLAAELSTLYRREGLDFLTVTDPGGNVLARAGALPFSLHSSLINRFLAQKNHGPPPCGLIILSRDELLAEGSDLARRARIALHNPPAGRPDMEVRGLALFCTAPLHDAAGRISGYLYGGQLLNNNFPLIDRLQEIVFGPDGKAAGGSATIFLGDLRIATTVRLADGDRAVGTLISRNVAAAVLERQRPWVDRALVVDRPYLTAYEPLRDSSGNVVGALYVGLPEEPFVRLKQNALFVLAGFLLFGILLGGLLARIGAGRISRPILALDASARRVADGEKDVRLPLCPGDEIGHLTESFNRMTETLDRKDEELRRFNRELEVKVEERSSQLAEQQQALLATREELARSERLAAIGSLAAGVAHEINNPAAIIRGNAELIRRTNPEAREETDEIVQQTERISLITRSLLTFARREKTPARIVAIDPLIGEILAQAGHQVAADQIDIHFTPAQNSPEVFADPEQLRQLLTNLIINALQALENSGRLTVTTRRDGDEVLVTVADTGPGIPAVMQEKIFHPFYTTRQSGTGLGLSIAYGIVQALGGTISVVSNEKAGTTFAVRLPAAGTTV